MSAPPPGVLGITLHKRRDGAVLLRCDRPDGSSTWMRYDGSKAMYLALHDLQHFAVETTLGIRRGFYGLVAEGWQITDFGTPWPRGPLPVDAEPVELIVSFLALEAASGERGTADELRAKLASTPNARTPERPSKPRVMPDFDDDALERVRTAADALRQRWLLLPPDGVIELSFPLR